MEKAEIKPTQPSWSWSLAELGKNCWVSEILVKEYVGSKKLFWSKFFLGQIIFWVPNFFSKIFFFKNFIVEIFSIQSFFAKLSQAPAPAGLSWLYFRFLQPSNHPPPTHPDKVYFYRAQPYTISSSPCIAKLATLLSLAPPLAHARLGLFYSQLSKPPPGKYPNPKWTGSYKLANG